MLAGATATTGSFGRHVLIPSSHHVAGKRPAQTRSANRSREAAGAVATDAASQQWGRKPERLLMATAATTRYSGTVAVHCFTL